MGICLVCQVPCVGNHLGISSCRACSSFFRRTVQLKRQYKCRFDENCDVTFKNRYSCRYCRFQVCLNVGMSAELAKSSSESTSSGCETPSTIAVDSPLPFEKPIEEESTNLNRDYDFFSKFMSYARVKIQEIFSQDHSFHFLPDSVPVTICQETLVAYRTHRRNQWPNSTPEKVICMPVVDVILIFHARFLALEKQAEFCVSVQTFASLPPDQKSVVYQRFYPRFEKLDRAYISYKLLGDDVSDTRIICFDGVITKWPFKFTRVSEVSDLSEEEIRSVMKQSEETFEKLFYIPFKRFKPDEFEFIFIVLSIMWEVEGDPDITPETLAIAARIREQIVEELHAYYVNVKKLDNYSSRIYKMRNLIYALDKIVRMRIEDLQLFKTFNVFKKNVYFGEFRPRCVVNQ